MSHVYNVQTPHGNVDLTTPHHHEDFDSLEDFIYHHKKTIETALGIAGLVINGVTAYYMGRKK